MQYALHDLRRWGFKKIICSYEKAYGGRQSLLKSVYELNTKLYDKKASAYSSIRMWDVIESFIAEEYGGMHLLMLNVEPLITSIRVDKACQRRFKNTWTALWRAFGSDADMDSSDIAVISDLGIRLCFADIEHLSLEDKCILEMYNTILCWYVLTLNEVNLDAFRLYPLELVEKMITMSGDDFIVYLLDSASIKHSISFMYRPEKKV